MHDGRALNQCSMSQLFVESTRAMSASVAVGGGVVGL
jgi:hypothetical protein